ncbi:MAG TPA: glycosyltransferase family 4 protein, partial [Chitinophagaceae bacterium]|nr:glycosyltransferase family 4 protein [Chitinophagaceae bacterium]
YGTLTGGAELQIDRIMKIVVQEGHQAAFFSSNAASDGNPVIADFQCYGTLGRGRTYLQVANRSARKQLKKALKEFQPDVIHLFIYLTQLSPLILSLIKDYPTLLTLCFYREICPKGTLLLPDNSLCQESWGKPCLKNKCLPLHQWLALEWQHRIFKKNYPSQIKAAAVSQKVKQRFEQAGWEIMDIAFLGVPGEQPVFQFSDSPVIVYGGRLVKEKGIWVLLEAFRSLLKRMPAVQLWIAGAGKEKKNIERWMLENKLENSIQLLGHLPFEEMNRKFSTAWVQVVPSLWTEPGSLTHAEAMMRGTPVIGTENAGLADYIKHGEEGWLVQPGNAADLEKGMFTILSDKILRDHIAREGHAFAMKNLEINITTAKHLALYEKARGEFIAAAKIEKL